MSKIPLVLVAVLLSLPAWASNPGEPLDCDDWVFVEPGLSCTVIDIEGCGATSLCNSLGRGVAPDNKGKLFFQNQFQLPLCSSGFPRKRHEIKRLSLRGDEELVGFVEDRCTSNGVDDVRSPISGSLRFDAVNGRLFLGLFSVCEPSCDATSWIAVIDGFATLADVLQDAQHLHP